MNRRIGLRPGGTYDESRFSTLTEINTRTVRRLGLAWFYDLDTTRGQESTPLAVDGVLYTTSAWSKVQAFEASSGKLLWQYDPQVPGATAIKACCDVVNRGAAYFNGRVFVGALDGRLIALDAKTGRVMWSVNTVDPSKGYTITGAPRVVKGRVIIGNGGAELGVRGYVSAYDAGNGSPELAFLHCSGAARGSGQCGVGRGVGQTGGWHLGWRLVDRHGRGRRRDGLGLNHL